MTVLPSRYPVKQIPRADFKPGEFRKLVATHGLDLRWEMASECPCARRSSGLGLTLDAGFGGNVGTTEQARSNCPTCQGRGYRYHSAQNIKGVVTGASHNPDRFRAYGEMARGMVSVSVLPEHRLNLGDRITLRSDPAQVNAPATVQLYRETHTYRGENPSATRYPIVRRALDVVPAKTLGVMDVYATDASGVAQPGGVRVEGVDFTVDAEGRVQWTNPPVMNARWSISYYGAPVYLVTDLPHPFRDTKVLFKRATPELASLPINAMCTLEFLASGRAT